MSLNRHDISSETALRDSPDAALRDSPDAALRALEWLVAMGADEIIQDEAVDRFVVQTEAPVKPALVAAPQRVAPQKLGPAKQPPAIPTAPPPSLDHCQTLEDVTAVLAEADIALKKTASNLCFAGGNLAAPLMVVGDVPGRDEDVSGRVFAGESEALLARMLQAIGLDFTSVSLFNFIPWRPPGNRTPTDIEINQCQPFLVRAIEICRPQFILCLGTVPAQRLSGKAEGLMGLRGKPLRFTAGGQQIPLLASFAPRYLLSRKLYKRLAWRDLLTFREMLDADS